MKGRADKSNRHSDKANIRIQKSRGISLDEISVAVVEFLTVVSDGLILNPMKHKIALGGEVMIQTADAETGRLCCRAHGEITHARVENQGRDGFVNLTLPKQ